MPDKPKGQEDARKPTPAQILSGLPAWPREWAQRVGQECLRCGARVEVRRQPSGGGWELRWVVGRRPLLALRPTPQGVVVEFGVPDTAYRRVLESPMTDEELRGRLLRTPSKSGRRRLVVGLDSARGVQSICEVVRAQTGGP